MCNRFSKERPKEEVPPPKTAEELLEEKKRKAGMKFIEEHLR